MKITQQQTPDPNDKRNFQAPNRNEATNLQVNTLLQIVGCMHMVLAQPPEAEYKRPEMDGEVKSSVEATLIKTCAQLDNIVDDNSRWSNSVQDSIEKKLINVYDGQLKVFETQIAVNTLMQTPHHRFRPLIFPTVDGEYIAVLGDPAHLDEAIYGAGPTPELALQAFDDVFAGKMPDYMVEWLAEREAAIKAGKEPPAAPARPKKTKEKQ